MNDKRKRCVRTGDVLYHCYGAHCNRTHEFARVVKITPKGKIRIQPLDKTIVSKDGDDTIVMPSDNDAPEKTKLLTRYWGVKRGTMVEFWGYGRGTIYENWDFYDPNKVYTDHFDRYA